MPRQRPAELFDSHPRITTTTPTETRMMSLPKKVKIVEVGPRDGLQNEETISAEVKIELVNRLSAAGFPNVEAAPSSRPSGCRRWRPPRGHAWHHAQAGRGLFGAGAEHEGL
jgi:hypothetical protein